VVLADGSGIPAAAVIAATGFSMDLDGLIGSLGVLDEKGKLAGGFASDVGNGIFAIGYGIPPNGPLRAIRRASTPLARKIATYLRAAGRDAAVSSATPAERKPLNSRFN
jgi:putative flavoprotein involved in K+ transport